MQLMPMAKILATLNGRPTKGPNSFIDIMRVDIHHFSLIIYKYGFHALMKIALAVAANVIIGWMTSLPAPRPIARIER